MSDRLPRPCRDADLQRTAEEGGVRRVAIVIDVVDGDVEASLDRWLRLLPRVPLHVCPYSGNRARVEAFAEARADSADISVAPGDWPLELPAMTAVGADCWATCAPYDASGVYVKRDIEALVLPALEASSAAFLAHDPSYGILRLLNARDVRSRLGARRRRLRVYRAVCRAVFGIAWVLARLARSPSRGAGAGFSTGKDS